MATKNSCGGKSERLAVPPRRQSFHVMTVIDGLVPHGNFFSMPQAQLHQTCLMVMEQARYKIPSCFGRSPAWAKAALRRWPDSQSYHYSLSNLG
jgi:hypothetical protein